MIYSNFQTGHNKAQSIFFGLYIIFFILITTINSQAFTHKKKDVSEITEDLYSKMNDKHFDVGNNFNTSTYRFTAPVTGKYLFTAAIQYGANGTSHSCFYINGGNPRDGWVDFGDATASAQSRIYDLVSGDYVQLAAYHTVTCNMSHDRAKMTGFLIG